MANLPVSPTVGIIDDSNGLTLSWPLVSEPTGFGPFSDYLGWDVFLSQTNPNLGSPTAFVPVPGSPSAGQTLVYTTTLAAGTWFANMQAKATAGPVGDSTTWEFNGNPLAPIHGLQFPDPLLAADVSFVVSGAASTSMLLGEPLTVTLQPTYVFADQWQIVWPDNTASGWLPLTANVIVKQFQISGALNVVIQTRKQYNSTSYTPPVVLMRQLSVQIFVVDQQFNSQTAAQAALTGTLGIGGQQGFEIVDATTGTVTPNPWEVIARAIVRDTVTNELKLLVATSRFADASSLLGTGAFDVFPIEGRPKSKELIQPVYEVTFNSVTSAIPVKITSATLPSNIFVGKPMPEFQLLASGGTQPYSWYTDGLPAGLKLSVNGILSGTPLALGTSSVNISVQDSSSPFYISEVPLPISVQTDLLVKIAANQTDANSTPLTQLGSSLGVAQVNKPFAVQMQVGNVDPTVGTPGGLPPYTWSTPAGSMPIGLSINSNTGLISGTPCTYNSTSDFTKTFSIVVQVTDAIGAKATHTYTMALEPAVLQFGSLNQPTIFAEQQFKLTIPIFGGVSPYTLDTFLADGPVSPAGGAVYSAATLVDGRIEIDVNFPLAGSRTFSLTIHDSTLTPITKQFTVTVETAISDPFLVPGLVDHVWSNPDVAYATPLPITGVFSGFSLGGFKVGLTSVDNVSAGTTVYHGTITNGTADAYLGITFVVSGFANPLNNGVFTCAGSSVSTLTLNNTAGVSESLPHALTILSADSAVVGSLTNPDAPFISTTTYHGTITGGANNAYVGQRFTITGFANPLTAQNNGTFYCVGSSATELILANGSGISEVRPVSPPTPATATQALAKALAFALPPSMTGNVPYPYGTTLSNGVVWVVDPVIPEVEFIGTLSGSPTPSAGTAQSIIPIQLQRNIGGGPITVAAISQPYSVLSEDNSSPSWQAGDIGAISVTTRPYLKGEAVGLNPREPFSNSTEVSSITPTPAPTDAPWVAAVLTNSSLPPGLSLDTNTGLIYGTVVGTFVGNNSVIQYVGVSGTVHGTVSIKWNIVTSDFPMIDSIQDGVALNTNYPSTSKITVPTGITPVSAEIYYGRLPVGLTINSTPSGQDFNFVGSATEGGYFDIWFKVVASSGTSYLFHRFSIGFIEPLIIATQSLPTASQAAYSALLRGFGGIPPYTWSSPNFPSGIGTGGFAGLSLNTSTGQISGTLSSPPVSPQDIGDIQVTLTDSRGTAVTDGTGYQPTLILSYNNDLRIVTPSQNGIATIFNPDPLGGGYSFQMQAAGGVPPYQWRINPASPLPSGITPISGGLSWNNGSYVAEPTGGKFGGTWDASPYVNPTLIVIDLKDSVGTQVPGTQFNIITSTSAEPIGIDSTGVGPIPRGEPYHGSLALTGPFVLSAAWYVAPDSVHTNALPSGLALQADGSAPTAGATATISGTYSGVPHVAGSFTISNVQRVGTLVTITTSPNNSLQVGDTVVVSATTQTAVNGTFTVTAVSGTFPASNATFQYNTVASGAIGPVADTGTVVGEGYQVRFIAVDNTGTDGQTAEAIVSFNTGTNLAIVAWDTVPATNAPNGYPFPLPNAVVTGSYGPIQLIAKNGVPVVPNGVDGGAYNQYVWSSSPSFPFDGISLAGSGSSSGQLSGTATILFSQSFTFTVADSLSNQASLALTLTSQASGLTITTVALPNATAGVPYSLQLTAASGSPPYTFSIASGNLPSGLNLSSTGLISGTTLQVGFNQTIVFRVTDFIGAYSNKPFNLTVVSGLTLATGIDFENSTSTGYLGFVDNGNVVSISPRPQLSFFVVAQNVVSTSPSQLTLIVSGGFSASVTNLDTTAHTAQIQLTGPFSSGAAGDNSLTISVTDSGVTANATFKWFVYADGTLVLAPSSGSIPVKLTTPN